MELLILTIGAAVGVIGTIALYILCKICDKELERKDERD